MYNDERDREGELCEEKKEEEEEEEEEVGPRSLLRSNMLSPHEVLSLPLGFAHPPDPTKPFSRSTRYVPPLHRRAPT